ncbi:MAG: efflux RND transporter permease subunit [Kiritimatiellia bacterium]
MIETMIQIGLKHKLLAFMLVLLVGVLGVFSLSQISIDAFPDISPNLVQVFAEVEGMAAEEVEQLVTRPAEAVMRSVPGVQKIRSLSSQGLATINIYFEDNINIYLARQMIAERMKQAESEIPTGIELPHGLEMGPLVSGTGKVLAYYLEAGDRDITEVRTLHKWIVRRSLEGVPGVAAVIGQGGFVRQYEVELSPEKLLARKLSVSDVREAIELNNANVGAGLITQGSAELIVRTLGRVSTIEELASTVVKSFDGEPVLIKDLGTVKLGQAFRRGVALLNGEREVVLGGIYKVHQANSFKVIQRLHQRMEEINATLPEGVKLVPYYDQSDLVISSINTVRSALFFGLLLVSIVAFLFLGNFRNAAIMVCSIPFAMLFGLILMERNGFPGDLISFGGMAIALGMIIDATIIMVEKLQTDTEKADGKISIQESIRLAAQEVGRPIVFAIAVIIIVFLPVFTLGEIEGKMFRPLAFAVTTTMAGSLIYALLIAPVFFQLTQRKQARQAKQKGGKTRTALLAGYERLLKRTIANPVLTIAILLMMLAGGSHGYLLLGREFIPRLQEGTIQCYAYMDPNVALDEIKKICANIASEAAQVQEVKNVIADIGYGEVGPHMHHTNYGCIVITLKPRSEWKNARSQDDIEAFIKARVGELPGVSIGFSQPIAHEVDELIAGAGADVVLKVFGDDIQRLTELTIEIQEILAQVTGVQDLRVEQTGGQTQLQVILNPSRLARYGLNKPSAA